MNQNLVSRLCPNCGADVGPATVGATIVCRFCGRTFQVASTHPARFPTSAAAAPRAQALPALTIVALVLVFGVAVSTLVAFRSASKSGGLGVLEKLAPTNFMWDSVGGPPIPVTMQGGEGFVGRVRVPGADTLFIVGFNHDLKEVWRSASLGTYSEGYASTHTEVVGDHVVVTDRNANVHLFDVATGKETASLKMSDRAKGMCASPDRTKVFIQVSDGQNLFVDPKDATKTAAAEPPSWCPASLSPLGDCRGWLTRGAPRTGCIQAPADLRASGFAPINAITAGTLAVALGKKQPGTAVPMAVGFDPTSHATRWIQPLAVDQGSVEESNTLGDMDALAGGRFFAPYQLAGNKGWHFVALDARSGERLWDVPLQPIIGVDYPEGFSASAERVYVTRTATLEVYEAKSGVFVGGIGL